MANPNTTIEELTSFLDTFLQNNESRYRTAPWLKSDFNDPIWDIESAAKYQINWNIPMDDGVLLTSSKHALLLDTLRSWIIIQTHVDVTGYSLLAPRSEERLIKRAIHCIDYLLLRSSSLGLSKFGLMAISSNDFETMISTIAVNRKLEFTIYQWSSLLSNYLRKQIATLSEETIKKALDEFPELAGPIPEAIDRLTNLSDREIYAARVWIHTNNLYIAGSNNYQYQPKKVAFTKILYEGTISDGHSKFSTPLELCILAFDKNHTEFPRARVVSECDERQSLKSIKLYIRTLETLNLLHSEGLSAPSINSDNLIAVLKKVDMKDIGRFRTLPHHVVFDTLGAALEYSLQYGDSLITSYLNIAKAALAAGQSLIFFANSNDILPFLDERTKELGVKQWKIGTNLPCKRTSDDHKVYFQNLRSNVGLYESIKVLYGAIQISVGTLMARRSGEFADLRADTCLDKTRSYLVFRNRKSGIGGMQEIESRPIPPVAVRLIEMLIRLQRELIEAGAISTYTYLFRPPKAKDGLLGESILKTRLKNCIMTSQDFFCDWIQTPLDKDGCRYYVRQHQLRRFFAMLFFYGGGFGGMDTLRWFLCHTDSKQLWHYITECTPGETIRSVAADWAVYGIRHATVEASLLGAELNEHFGTSDFTVLDDDALTLYIEDLLESGRLTIEPEFLDNNKHYRIAVVLRPKDTLQ